MHNYNTQTKRLSCKPDKIELPKSLSGLTRSHRLIMIEKHREIQFMVLCDQIRLNDLRLQRADWQRNERQQKRLKKSSLPSNVQ
jgi:hypothetical protein